VSLAAVVLAAGAGARLGGVAKALLPAGDASFLARIAATARAAAVGELVVVVGPPFGPAVAAAARGLGATVVDNPDPARGMASSVALGFGALAARGPAAPAAALLWPVDHPRVAVATVARLIARGAGVPVHAGRGGHPALVPARLFAALAGCAAAPDGARGVLRGELPRIPVDDPGVVADVDVPADLERAWPG